jgi:hypothetical protein
MEAEEKEVSEKEEEERKEEELSEREGERWRGVEGLEKGRLSHSHSASQWAVVTLPAGVLTDIRLHVVTQTPLNLVSFHLSCSVALIGLHYNYRESLDVI